MSEWMVSEVVRCGGRETTNLGEADVGHFRAEYRGFYLWWIQDRGELHVARIDDFDRWANSRVYEGEAPTTMETLDARLDGLATAEPRRDVVSVLRAAYARRERR